MMMEDYISGALKKDNVIALGIFVITFEKIA